MCGGERVATGPKEKGIELERIVGNVLDYEIYITK